MEITLLLNEGLAREFKIAINASDIKARVDAKLNEISKQVKMPGFRPGKVPISVVKARYGEQSKGEVIQAMLDEACLLYTSPSPRDRTRSRMPSSA